MRTFVDPSRMRISYQPTILVLEDNLDDLFYLTAALKLFGCKYITASDAMNALSIAQKEQPDLILLDICLPQISGIELLNILRIDWLTRNIPVIAITGLAGAEERKEIANAGFDRCLIKPYLLKDLEHIIDVHINSEHLS